MHKLGECRSVTTPEGGTAGQSVLSVRILYEYSIFTRIVEWRSPLEIASPPPVRLLVSEPRPRGCKAGLGVREVPDVPPPAVPEEPRVLPSGRTIVPLPHTDGEKNKWARWIGSSKKKHQNIVSIKAPGVVGGGGGGKTQSGLGQKNGRCCSCGSTNGERRCFPPLLHCCGNCRKIHSFR